MLRLNMPPHTELRS